MSVTKNKTTYETLPETIRLEINHYLRRFKNDPYLNDEDVIAYMCTIKKSMNLMHEIDPNVNMYDHPLNLTYMLHLNEAIKLQITPESNPKKQLHDTMMLVHIGENMCHGNITAIRVHCNLTRNNTDYPYIYNLLISSLQHYEAYQLIETIPDVRESDRFQLTNLFVQGTFVRAFAKDQ